MNRYSLTHSGDGDLERNLVALVACDSTTTADLVAHIAEFDARKLYVPKGYASMFAYCVERLHLSEDEAFKRIRAGRTARQYPAFFPALAEGRLHLTAVVLLTPFLTAENAAELLAAAEGKSKAEIQRWLARRFPQPDLPTRLEPIASHAAPGGQLVPEPVGGERVRELSSQLVPEPVATRVQWPKVAPLSRQRFLLQAPIPERAHDKLRYIQALLGHAVPSGDLAEVLERSFDAHIAQLEKQKIGATSRARGQRAAEDPRRIPTAVKRAVWERDGGQCGFVGEDGHRCGSSVRLEFDHVDPVARGGEATIEGIRLRCRAHNQYEAECVFGAGFMASKREAARLAAAEARARTAAARAAAAEEHARAAAEKREKAAAEAQAAAAEQDPEHSVVPWLRQLGIEATEARGAAALCEHMTDAPIEERVKAALRHLRPRTLAPGRAA